MGGKIGVLALQGAFAKHMTMLERMGITAIEVRKEQELKHIDGLIIPGGESTTMLKLNTLPLTTFDKPIFGTCAGLILMAHLGLLAIEVKRNAYGPQSASFSSPLTLHLNPPHTMSALFIRAPRITAIRSPEVTILANLETPVMVRQGNRLATTFHPELTNDPAIHHYFVKICNQKPSLQQPSTITPTKSFQMT